ncbi:MAG TPA: hypothetical protein VF789_21190 [Thermoanaerobaculia bacterium]
MNERMFRCPFSSILVFALLLTALPALAAADEVPRITPQEKAAFLAVAPEQARSCQRCVLAHQKCSTTCFSLADKVNMGSCLTACDNATSTCSCDESVTLRSEDVIPWNPLDMNKAACNGNVSCQPYYPSCASWSGYSDCGTPYCGFGPKCGECVCDEWGRCFCGPGPAWKYSRERFRVCFDALGNSCTEWQTYNYSACGC